MFKKLAAPIISYSSYEEGTMSCYMTSSFLIGVTKQSDTKRTIRHPVVLCEFANSARFFCPYARILEMSVFSTRNCVWHRHAVPTAQESPVRSERIQPIGRFANAEMFSWEERLHQTTFSYFFDACWLLLEVIHFAFQSDEATWRWNHLVGLPTHTKKHRRWSQWNDRLDLYREVKMFIWIESHRMLLTLEISWVLPFHEDVAR